MDIETKETYSEVYSILNLLGECYIMKLPPKLYKMIKEEKSNEYTPQYDYTIKLEHQNIKREALSMIALFHLNYWCNSEEEKQELKKIFNENEIKYQTELKEKYNSDNIFKKLDKDKRTNLEKTENNNDTSLIEYKESFFSKFKNFIFIIFHINKKFF